MSLLASEIACAQVSGNIFADVSTVIKMLLVSSLIKIAIKINCLVRKLINFNTFSFPQNDFTTKYFLNKKFYFVDCTIPLFLMSECLPLSTYILHNRTYLSNSILCFSFNFLNRISSSNCSTKEEKPKIGTNYTTNAITIIIVILLQLNNLKRTSWEMPNLNKPAGSPCPTPLPKLLLLFNDLLTNATYIHK